MEAFFDAIFVLPAGGWGYPCVQSLSAATFLTAFLLIPVLLALAYLSGKAIDRHEGKIVALWLLVGFAAQLWLLSLAPFRMGALVESQSANSFYTVTQEHPAWEFITDFDALVRSLPLHARSNMPGKTLLFYLLETVSGSTQVMAYLIILISNVGGALTYLLAKKWFQCPLTALYAMIFYLFMPAKLYFFPILNTVTPVLMLLSLLLFTLYLTSKQDRYLLALGASLYGLLLFEPLPFVTGLIFLAFLGKYLLAGELDRFHLIKIMVYVPGAFLLTHLVLLGTLGFDILAAFSFAMDDARSFNATTGRSYRLWVVHNLKDFFLNMGIAQSALFVISLGAANWKVATLLLQRTGTRGEFRAYLLRNDVVLLMAFSLVLLVLDLLGVNRGETIRLWIFLGVILQIVAARYCAVGRRFWVFALVLALTILQAALCLSAVAFSWPDQVGEEFIRRYMGS